MNVEEKFESMVNFLRREADAVIELTPQVDEDTSHIFWEGYDGGENAGSVVLARYLVNRFKL